MKLIIICIQSTFVLFAATFSINSHADPGTNIVSCAMLDGNLSHKIVDLGESGLKATFTYPPYYQNPPQELLDRKKKEWLAWDGIGPAPTDPRKVGFAVPLGYANIISYDIGRLITKAAFFQTLFPTVSADSGETIRETGTFSINFDPADCRFNEQEGLMSSFCENRKSITRMGVDIEASSIRITSKEVRDLEYNEETGELEVKTELLVFTDLVLFVNSTYHRSTFVYKPNGDEVQCWFKEKSLK